MSAPMSAPSVANRMTNSTLTNFDGVTYKASLSLLQAWYAAGGTITSDGNGMNELSIVISNVTVP